jgi:hypothetical protein
MRRITLLLSLVMITLSMKAQKSVMDTSIKWDSGYKSYKWMVQDSMGIVGYQENDSSPIVILRDTMQVIKGLSVLLPQTPTLQSVLSSGTISGSITLGDLDTSGALGTITLGNWDRPDTIEAYIGIVDGESNDQYLIHLVDGYVVYSFFNGDGDPIYLNKRKKPIPKDITVLDWWAKHSKFPKYK